MHTRSTRRSMRDRPTVICLHSSGSSGGQWSALRARLEPGVQTMTPDLYSHGAGPVWHGSDEGIVAADAARVARLAESVPGGAHLIGHSYGGAIALRVALFHPRTVRSVAVYEPVVFRLLFDYHGRRRPASEIIELARELRRQLRAENAAGAASRFVDYWGGPGAWGRLSLTQQATIAKRIAVVAAHFASLANDAPRLADYASLRAPVLMLAGSEVRAPVQRINELLRFTLPNVAFETMSAMGHLGPITHSHAVAHRFARFVWEHTVVDDAPERELAA